MLSRLVVVTHVWPGITPFNVYSLKLEVWLIYAHAADAWQKAREAK